MLTRPLKPPTSIDWQNAAEDFRKKVGAAHGFAGWVACEAGTYALCVTWLRRQEEILGALYAEGPLYLAAALLALGQQDVEIVRMSVATDMRRRGIARRMLACLCDTAQAAGYCRVFLETTSTWHGVIQFYLDYGFRITHEKEGAFGGETYFELLLE